jgi:hypothetical protein
MLTCGLDLSKDANLTVALGANLGTFATKIDKYKIIQIGKC